VNDLKLTISPEKVSEITQAMTENTIAYEHFQKGRGYMSRYTPKDMDSSIVEFKKAIQVDPGFASAYGLLANAFWLKVDNYGASKTLMDSAEFYAKKGLEFDDYCAECYKALAGVEIRKYRNRVKAIELQKKALEINPNYGAVMQNMFRGYYAIGEYEKGFDLVSRNLKVYPDRVPLRLRGLYRDIGEIKKAKAYFDIDLNKRGGINKAHRNLVVDYANYHFDIGDVEGFKKLRNRVFQIDQDSAGIHWTIIASYWLEKKYDEVTAYYEENHDAIGNWGGVSDWVAHSYLSLGKNTEANQFGIDWLESLEKAEKSSKWSAYNISFAYLLKNQKEQSVVWLERAIEIGWLITDISKDAFFESLKDHPRFQELVSKQKKKREEVMALVATYNFPEPEDL